MGFCYYLLRFSYGVDIFGVFEFYKGLCSGDGRGDFVERWGGTA